MTDDMGRRHGNGTYDRSTKTFKIRTASLVAKASIRFLSEKYHVNIPEDERQAERYWRMHLGDLRRKQILDSEFDLIMATAERIDNPNMAGLEVTATMSDGQKIDLAHLPGIGAVLDTRRHRHAATKSIKAEVETYIARRKEKGHHGWYDVRTALELLLSITGDISVKMFDMHHYRAFVAKVKEHPTWSDRTKKNRQKDAKAFLAKVGINYGLTFGFLDDTDYSLPMPCGQKTKWTMEEVRTAMKHATGIVRTAVLLGCNCGFYRGDIASLTPEKFDGTHINTSRAKLEYKQQAFVGSWKLWPETKEALQYGIGESTIAKSFSAFRQEHSLPEQSDLRKTVSQWIEDEFGEDVARLYRGESAGDTHGQYYSEFTAAKRAKLDKALDWIRTHIMG